jgi:DNA-binding transcriptional LysR family regulator
MSRKIDWENKIGRRLKLRDLHALLTAVQRGSISKAAHQLGVSQPAVSEAIADLEHALGVRLLDRRPHGVEPTMYGDALLKRSTVVFDDLKQSIRDIEFLADPAAGELKIGCPEAIAAILPPILERFSRQYPRVVLSVGHADTATLELPGLRKRRFDLVVGLLPTTRMGDGLEDDLNIEVLFNDHLVVASGMRSQWARRRKIDLAELINEPWILAGPETGPYKIISEALRIRGLSMPKISLMTLSVHLRTNMVASGHFITTFPHSVVRLHADRFSLKVLPVDLPARPWPVAIVTLKNRALSPIVERFIGYMRDFTRPMRERQPNQR